MPLNWKKSKSNVSDDNNIDSNDVEYEMNRNDVNMITHQCCSKSTLRKYWNDLNYKNDLTSAKK